MNPIVSFVVPARDERNQLPATLSSIANQQTSQEFEVIIADGNSDDGTVDVATEWIEATSIPARVVEGPGAGIGHGRNLGARSARGDWFAFIDADTIVAENYLDTMTEFVIDNDLDAATSDFRFKPPRGVRARFVEWVNRTICLSSSSPVLPGFNIFIRSDTFREIGGFPEVPNEDVAFSREIVEFGETGVVHEPLVRTSPRRLQEYGLIGMVLYYYKLKLR